MHCMHNVVRPLFDLAESIPKPNNDLFHRGTKSVHVELKTFFFFFDFRDETVSSRVNGDVIVLNQNSTKVYSDLPNSATRLRRDSL